MKPVAMLVLLVIALPTLALGQADSLRKVNDDFQKAKNDLDDETTAAFCKRVLALAEKSSARAKFNSYAWVFYICSHPGADQKTCQPLRAKAMDGLLANFAKSSLMTQVLTPYMEAANRQGEEKEFTGYIERISAKTKDKGVLALGLAIRADMIIARDQAYGIDDADRQKAIGYLEKLLEEYGDVKDPGGRPFKASCAAKLKALKNPVKRHSADSLEIGATAPDIAGADMDGVKFKLSDYRGKVVMLDFWGHW